MRRPLLVTIPTLRSRLYQVLFHRSIEFPTWR
jgi:hypothetical protein